MTVLLQMALSALVVVGLLFAVRSKADVFGPALVAGIVFWGIGLGFTVFDALSGAAAFPTIGHVMWVGAAPLIVGGVFMRGGAHRTYVGPMLGYDVALVSVAWLMLIYKVSVWRPGGNGLQDVDWFALVVVLSELLMFVVVWLLTANLPSPSMFAISVAGLLFICSEALVLWSQGRDADIYWVRLGLLIGTILLTIVSIAVMRPQETLPTEELERASRARGPVTMVLVATPLLPYIATMRGGAADAGSLVLSGALLFSFAAREIYRSIQNKALLTQLADQARRDPLTGLANRRALAETMRWFGGRADHVCVMTVDVDRFKEINRQLGHGTGDQVLAALGALLSELPDMASFRLGGDEFAVISVLDEPSAQQVAEGLRARAATELARITGVEAIAVTLSIGIAFAPPDERRRDPLSALSRSSQALRVAKDERNRVRFYSDEDARRIAEQERLEQRLRQAIAEHRIGYIFQPIISLAEGMVVSLEALARWQDDELGTVSPADFVPMAERTGLIHDLGWQCLRSSVALQEQLYLAGWRVGLSVNVSPVQLRRDTFHGDLLGLLTDHGLPPRALTIEVTEGVFIDLDDSAVSTLRKLHATGFGIAIDDFGSGYSSLGYLTRLPADVLKVDKTLIGRLHRPEPRSIISALLDVASAHGVQVVMEGVDHEKLAQQLRALGARYAQGWLYSPGVPAEDVAELITLRGAALIPARFKQRPRE